MPDWSDHSRFRRQAPISVDGVETMGKWAEPSWLKTRPDQSQIGSYLVDNSTEYKPHLIAEQVYGDSTMDWVLIAFNRVRDPFTWPRSGTLIEYPAESLVFQEL
jgi:hypothetical protein